MCSRAANSACSAALWALIPTTAAPSALELGQRVAVGAALRRAAAGARDVVPAVDQRLAGDARCAGRRRRPDSPLSPSSGEVRPRRPSVDGSASRGKLAPRAGGRRRRRPRNRQAGGQLRVLGLSSSSWSGRVGWRPWPLRRLPARDEPRQEPPGEERGPDRGLRGARDGGGRDLPRQRQRDLRRSRRGGEATLRQDGRSGPRRRARTTTCRSSSARRARSRSIAAQEPFDGKGVERVRRASCRSRCCRRSPPPRPRKKALALATDEDALAIRGRELYWLPSGGMLDSELDLKALEKTARAMDDADDGHGRADRRQALRRRLAPASERGRAATSIVGADRADLVRQLGELRRWRRTRAAGRAGGRSCRSGSGRPARGSSWGRIRRQ